MLGIRARVLRMRMRLLRMRVRVRSTRTDRDLYSLAFFENPLINRPEGAILAQGTSAIAG